eukprot:TRINITY_DN3367_c0_g1_i2.p1 TRINITY_DN3367_c0_g1~~TRINITY_DN3367_c0_g1_i2.p1  ORF type:complete len:497 (+),score=63.64 TRINITY_DN3367_c0_g1_i2:58-1548(+)
MAQDSRGDPLKQLLSEIALIERQLQSSIVQRDIFLAQVKDLGTHIDRLQESLEDKKREFRIQYDREDSKFKLLPGINESVLCQNIPVVQLNPILSASFCNTIIGPSGDTQPLSPKASPPSPIDLQTHGDKICVCNTSTYPWIPESNARQGDPIADRYALKVYSNGVIFALADGCNWGRLPCEAASRASESFVEFLSLQLHRMLDSFAVAPLLLSALTNAHQSIITGYNLWESGTTTLLGGVLLQQKEGGWICMLASIGDCKVFHWDRSTCAITDVTKGNRADSVDASDPGGRLGQYVGKDGQPDLRNLIVSYQACNDGDLLFLVSDGVHDNIDPQQLGIAPNELGIPAPTWDEAKKMHGPMVAQVKNDFRASWLSSRPNSADRNIGLDNITPSGPVPPPEELTPFKVVSTLVRHCLDLTRHSREFMENNPTMKQPVDYKKYPGKMDHTSAMCIRVGTMPHILNRSISESSLPSPPLGIYHSISRHNLIKPRGDGRS